MSSPTQWCLTLSLLCCPTALAQQARDAAAASIDTRADHYAALAKRIWGFAEVGYQETKSSGALQQELRENGFAVEAGVAGMPTAFVATAGAGKPIIALLAEFDALPGLSQEAIPARRPIVVGGAGHACGHHLFGTASCAAGIAVGQWLAQRQGEGTIRVYGTPAEEGGAGKVYMVRAGLFDDVDAVLHWHASDRNDASPATSLANRSAKFRFVGVPAHAASAPHVGRSALDGVEAMNNMVNLMREHVQEKTRIHYVITKGGDAPNVVPGHAEVYYYVRHPSAQEVERVFARVVKAAEGAALGTGTNMEFEIIHGAHSLLPNEPLARVVDRNLRRLGGIEYDAEELAFARRIRRGLARPDALQLGSEREVQPFQMTAGSASTDVGDVSWTVPTAGLYAATWVPGTPGHSWQAVATGGTSIGTKGMLLAAKTLTWTAMDLFENPEHLEQARSEFDRRRGPDFVYRAMLGDRSPPLDYRK